MDIFNDVNALPNVMFQYVNVKQRYIEIDHNTRTI